MWLAVGLGLTLIACPTQTSAPREEAALRPWLAAPARPARPLLFQRDFLFAWNRWPLTTCEHILEVGYEHTERTGSTAPTLELSGLARPLLTVAEDGDVRRVFGEPCPHMNAAWAVPMAWFGLSGSADRLNFAAVTETSVLQMPDGRKVLLAAVRPGDAHVAQGFFAAMFLDGRRPHFFVMEGGGSF